MQSSYFEDKFWGTPPHASFKIEKAADCSLLYLKGLIMTFSLSLSVVSNGLHALRSAGSAHPQFLLLSVSSERLLVKTERGVIRPSCFITFTHNPDPLLLKRTLQRTRWCFWCSLGGGEDAVLSPEWKRRTFPHPWSGSPVNMFLCVLSSVLESKPLFYVTLEKKTLWETLTTHVN